MTLSATSVIDMGAGSSVLRFAESHLETWVGTLRVFNWSGIQNLGGGTDQLFFGDGSRIGLDPAQLTQIKFYSDAGTTILPFAPGFSAFTGGFGEVVPAPEPSGVIAALVLCSLARVARAPHGCRRTPRQRPKDATGQLGVNPSWSTPRSGSSDPQPNKYNTMKPTNTRALVECGHAGR